MGVHRENGYSASIEAFLIIDGHRFALAKTNEAEFYLAESCESPPNTDAEMLIVIDGASDTQRVTLPDGIVLGQCCVRYEVAVPF